jgi:hypothetical protein
VSIKVSIPEGSINSGINQPRMGNLYLLKTDGTRVATTDLNLPITYTIETGTFTNSAGSTTYLFDVPNVIFGINLSGAYQYVILNLTFPDSLDLSELFIMNANTGVFGSNVNGLTRQYEIVDNDTGLPLLPASVVRDYNPFVSSTNSPTVDTKLPFPALLFNTPLSIVR